MARLIDADKLFPYGAVPYVPGDGFETADKIYGIIKNAPTVDAVEVVRCKDCKHHCGVVYGNRCKKWSSYHAGLTYFTDANDFCSYGERRTE